MSLAGLDCYLSLNYVPSPRTLVEGIEKLAPGSWLKWRDGEVNCDAYWKIPAVVSRDWTMDEAKEELDLLLKQSVREHLSSDVPVGVWLSGGIDSSTVLHYAAAQASAPDKDVFDIISRGRVATRANTSAKWRNGTGPITEYSTSTAESNLRMRSRNSRTTRTSRAPTPEHCRSGILSKMSRTKTTVALSGEGADELFGGYLTYRADRIASYVRRFPAKRFDRARGSPMHIPSSDESIGFDYKVKRLLEGCLLPAERAHTFWNGTFSRAQKDAMLKVYLPGRSQSIWRTWKKCRA